MATTTTSDGTTLYYEDTGSGLPIVFVHEYAGDCRAWEPQVRYLSRNYRCVTFNARGYPPSGVPKDEAAYSQDAVRDDVIAVMARLAESCKRHGKFWGTLGPGKEMFRQVKGLGAQLICPGGDVRVMLNGVRELAKTFAAD